MKPRQFSELDGANGTNLREKWHKVGKRWVVGSREVAQGAPDVRFQVLRARCQFLVVSFQ
jgi:hypothetical protein